jgi:hypothetical protein
MASSQNGICHGKGISHGNPVSTGFFSSYRLLEYHSNAAKSGSTDRTYTDVRHDFCKAMHATATPAARAAMDLADASCG